MEERPAQAPRERFDLFRRVVDALQHDILEEQLPPRPGHVAFTGREHGVERIAPVQRHETVAQDVGARVKAHGEVQLQGLAGEPLDPGDDPGRRHRDGPGGEPEAGGVVQQAAGAERLVVVVEGLPHPHEDHVGDVATFGLEGALGGEDLVDHLLSAQVAPQTQPS